MAAEIRARHPDAEVELIKGGGGDFIVLFLDQDPPRELWNKNASGRGFPEPSEILDLL